MKVLLIDDVYKLGRAGDVKKVANGFGRNYLIPQGLAVLATPGALKQTEHIRTRADVKRAIVNEEMSGVAEQISELVLVFPAKAGETGKLYGSVTPQMIADDVNQKLGLDISRRQLDTQPIRMLGIHKANIRLTMDLVPEFKVIVHLEGESPDSVQEEEEVVLESQEVEPETEISALEEISEPVSPEGVVEDESEVETETT
jgi:large subunit ribosomal protein L9